MFYFPNFWISIDVNPLTGLDLLVFRDVNIYQVELFAFITWINLLGGFKLL